MSKELGGAGRAPGRTAEGSDETTRHVLVRVLLRQWHKVPLQSKPAPLPSCSRIAQFEASWRRHCERVGLLCDARLERRLRPWRRKPCGPASLGAGSSGHLQVGYTQLARWPWRQHWKLVVRVRRGVRGAWSECGGSRCRCLPRVRRISGWRAGGCAREGAPSVG
eukprot:scaffold268683_cov33-Tisochrysis_lutea.AAC.1